jgi:hypothetical protein
MPANVVTNAWTNAGPGTPIEGMRTYVATALGGAGIGRLGNRP